MTAAPAPFHADVADAPPDANCLWATASDGVRLRLCHWSPETARGTILLFPGRTEYIEKYGPAARRFGAAGFATLVIDWRGQGLSDRLTEDPNTGHVLRFDDYQRDVAALVSGARSAGLPEPFHLLAHSMGGAIGLAALMDGLPVARAAFSSPMWGITIAPALRPVAWSLSWAASGAGLGHRFAPGTTRVPYPEATAFETNLLTGDPEQFAWLTDQVSTHPELGLGGPSMGWLNQALRACRGLSRRPSPRVPCLTILGSEEKIVDPDAIRDRMERWPGGTLTTIEGGRHETLFETPDRRDQVYDALIRHFLG